MAGPEFNRVMLIGNLVRDPELRYTPSGTAVADLRVAVNSTFGRGEERREETTFVDVTVWARMAEVCSEYLAKGRSVLVEGSLRQDEWQDRETGKKRSRLYVRAQNVQFLGGGGDGGGRRGGPSRGRESAPSEPSQSEEKLEQDFQANDDVPF